MSKWSLFWSKTQPLCVENRPAAVNEPISCLIIILASAESLKFQGFSAKTPSRVKFHSHWQAQPERNWPKHRFFTKFFRHFINLLKKIFQIFLFFRSACPIFHPKTPLFLFFLFVLRLKPIHRRRKPHILAQNDSQTTNKTRGRRPFKPQNRPRDKIPSLLARPARTKRI